MRLILRKSSVNSKGNAHIDYGVGIFASQKGQKEVPLRLIPEVGLLRKEESGVTLYPESAPFGAVLPEDHAGKFLCSDWR